MSLPRSERGPRAARRRVSEVGGREIRERASPRSGWCVYLLSCVDGSLYAGATNDLSRRLEVHGRGRGARYTRSRLPVELAWTARAKDRSAALRREAALKQLSRAEKLALVARGDRRRLARRPRRAATTSS